MFPLYRFDEELWNLLEEDVKLRISQDIRQNAQKRMLHIEKLGEDLVGPKAAKFNPFVKLLKLIRITFMREFAAPPKFVDGYNSNTWYARWWLQRVTVKSRVLHFFSTSIEDPDSAVSAMALVCALVLTIPFTVYAMITDSYLTTLKRTIEACPGGMDLQYNLTYHQIYCRLIGYPALTMYSSITGLCVSSTYFVFKPTKGREVDRWCRNQGRLLLCILAVACVVSVAALVITASTILTYFSIELSNICTPRGNTDWLYFNGNGAIGIGFVLAIIAMW